MSHTHKLTVAMFGLACIATGAIGLWPEGELPVLDGAAARPFAWDRAELFQALERDFTDAGSTDVDALLGRIDAALGSLDEAVVPVEPLAALEKLQFQLAVAAAAHPEHLRALQTAVHRVRTTVLAAARTWPVDNADVHAHLYRVIFGGRAAIDEAWVQAGSAALAPLARISHQMVPAQTPSTEVRGVQVHSGDIVLTRGGAPTSALIARGNDFPGNFSHAALVYVDESGTASVIEALIERGLVVSTLDDFLRDKKLRILLLRPRPEVVASDPTGPHRVASEWLRRAREERLGYDFAMDWSNDDAVFCSEVVYHAYRELNVELWGFRSTISSPGLVTWLGMLGVRNFVTLVPSDLEYDPQLAPVAEWRDPRELRRERRDNAIIDALLEEAERGTVLGYAWYQLLGARLLKAWSRVAGFFGAQPMIPDGMSSATAARVNGLRHQIYDPMRSALDEKETAFHRDNGYPPPYWRLVPLAREALAKHREAMSPALE
jgi:hypothetical protein